jgi:type IV pilus assembly protein PilP
MKTMRLLFLVAASLATVACSSSGDVADLQVYVDDVGSKPRGRVEPIPEFKPYEAFTYRASALRSPFSLPAVPEESERLNSNGMDVRPDKDRSKEYLEQFDIDQLGMVGTLQKPKGDLFALIKDGYGGVVRVREGEYMGRNHGRIVSIQSDRMNLIEIVPDGQGGWLERPRTLALNGAPGE